MSNLGFETDQNGSLTILERIAASEKSAIEECIRVYGDRVRKIAAKYRNDDQDVEDAMQEIFTSIWMNAHKFDAKRSNEIGFIRLLAQRKSIDLFRRNCRHPLEVELDDSRNFAPDDYHNILLTTDLTPIFEALMKLPQKEAELIESSVFDGTSHTEIAEIFQMPLGTVKSKIRRGINKLKKMVGKPFLVAMHKSYYG